MRATYADLLDRVNELDPRALHGEDQTSLLMLRETIASDIAELDTGLLDWNVDPLEGVPADFLLVPDYQRLETPDDGDRMLARWRGMAVYTDRHLDSLRRSLLEGKVACLAPGERTVAILEHLLDGETRDWPLLAPLGRRRGRRGLVGRRARRGSRPTSRRSSTTRSGRRSSGCTTRW